MVEKIRVGIVGANAGRGSWGTRAHIPALQGLPDFDLRAICTAHEETAREAARAFGVGLAFHDYHLMVAHSDVDLAVVSVRVPYHHEIVMAALQAGKDVYCEWPLGANLVEAEEMASLARSRSAHTMVGLQARSDPAVLYLRELIADGYIGEVLACNLTVIGGGAGERTSDRIWPADRVKGVSTLTIQGGHSIDALCFCLGEFAEVSARVATQVRQWRVSDTGATVEVTAPDNVLVCGVLESGAVASIHVASVPFNGSGWRLEIYGREGTLLLLANQSVNIGPNRLLGAKGGAALAELPVPDRFSLVPEGTPPGPPRNVAQAYARFADGLRAGRQVDPDFDLAVRRHRLLDGIERASDSGQAVRLT